MPFYIASLHIEAAGERFVPGSYTVRLTRGSTGAIVKVDAEELVYDMTLPAIQRETHQELDARRDITRYYMRLISRPRLL